jgi:hypothetical protein
VTAAREVTRLFVLPFLYFLCVAPVVAGIAALLALEGRYFGFGQYNTWYFNGDATAVAALLLVGGFVFAACSWILVRLDGLRRPVPADHLRQCGFLYAFFCILGVLFAAEYLGNVVAGRPMNEAPLAAVIWLAAGYGVLVNAAVLIRRRRRDAASIGGRP